MKTPSERDAEAVDLINRKADELIAELERLIVKAGRIGSGCLARSVTNAERVKSEMAEWQEHRTLYKPETLYVGEPG